jgi:dTDP-4-amino-4,6-dideoxygalactose transaminase
MINLFQPSLGEAEVQSIREVFASNWLGPGPRVQAFEERFATYIGRAASEVIAVTNCTEALFQAVMVLSLCPEDEVILPAISFIGAAHAVRSAGARVVLCDVDSTTLNPTPEHFERAITPRTKAAIILHFGGCPGHVAEIAHLAGARSIFLIEDAAIAMGSFAAGQACGTFGEVGCWSFDSMKLLATGDGGMIWAKRPLIARRMRSSIRLGLEESGFERRAHAQQWWEVHPNMVGRWARMNDVTAALGLIQLERLPSFLQRRAEVAARYTAELCELAWVRLPPPARDGAAWTFYWVQTAPELRHRLARHFLQNDIYTSFRYWPLHRTAMYADSGLYPGADLAAASTLLLPLHQALSPSDITRIVEVTRAFCP